MAVSESLPGYVKPVETIFICESKIEQQKGKIARYAEEKNQQ